MKTLAALTVLVAAALPAVATAAPIPVTAGKLDWATVAVYDQSAPADTQRTWLGYLTGNALNGASFGANGSATPSAGSTGDTVTTSSARGATYGWSFPRAAGGTYDAAAGTIGTGTLEHSGTLTFFSPGPAPAAGHDFTLTVESPRVVLNGSSGQVFASGLGSRTPPAYDRTAPVFDLDFASATVTDLPGGRRTITGIVPRVATPNLLFPEANYPAGHGPNRTPNTFGSFALDITATSAALSPAPAGRSFGTVTTGFSSVAQTFTVTNTGTDPLVVGTAQPSGADADQFALSADQCSGQTVAPAGSCTLQAVFRPTSGGAKTASLRIPSNADGNPHQLPLEGVGSVPADPPAGAPPAAPAPVTPAPAATKPAAKPAAGAIRQIALLRTAPFTGNGKRSVRIYDRNGRLLGAGTIQRRTLRLTLAKAMKRKLAKGNYVLRRAAPGMSRRAVSIRILR